jgi:regulator of RNase E activity RraA
LFESFKNGDPPMTPPIEAERLHILTSAFASDALDRLGHRDQACAPVLHPLRPGQRVAGRALPVAVVVSDEMPDEPYAGEMRAIELLQPGDVPVYATEPGVRAAVWGELFTLAARGRGAVGAIVDGPLRDADAIAALGFPVFHASFSPLDTMGRAVVADIGGDVTCAGVRVRRGDYVVADEDGVVVLPAELAAAVVEHVEAKLRGERGARDDLLAGKSVRDVWDTWGVF